MILLAVAGPERLVPPASALVGAVLLNAIALVLLGRGPFPGGDHCCGT
jgi:hypothetical protein